MKAIILPNEIAVVHSVRPDIQREFLKFSVEGWDEVKKLNKKVLLFDGRRFTFTAWNSDTNECYFVRYLNDTPTFATILSK